MRPRPGEVIAEDELADDIDQFCAELGPDNLSDRVIAHELRREGCPEAVVITTFGFSPTPFTDQERLDMKEHVQRIRDEVLARVQGYRLARLAKGPGA